MHGFAFSAEQASSTSRPCFVPICVCTNTTLPDSFGTGGAAVAGFVPRIWSMLTTLIPDLIADLIVGDQLRPEDRLDDDRVVLLRRRDRRLSCESCFFGSLAASKTVTLAPLAFATALAAASIGAS